MDADDALLEEAGEDVVGALPAGGGLDDHGDEAVLAVRREPLRLVGRRGEERPRGRRRRDEPARPEPGGARAQAQRAGPGRGPRRGGRERGGRGEVGEGERGGGRHGRGRVGARARGPGGGGAGDLRRWWPGAEVVGWGLREERTAREARSYSKRGGV
jgi:hypothetical protein